MRLLHRSGVWGGRPVSTRLEWRLGCLRSAKVRRALLKECSNCFFGFCRPHAHGKLLELTANRLPQLLALGTFHQVLTNPHPHRSLPSNRPPCFFTLRPQLSTRHYTTPQTHL